MLTVTLYSDGPIFSGGERYVELLATGFDRDEVRAQVVLSTERALDSAAERLAARGLPVARLPAVTTLGEARAFLRVFRHLAVRRTHVIHANLVDPRACNGALVAAALAGHRNLVATEHLPQSPFDSKPTPFRHRVAMALVRRRIVNTTAWRDVLIARGAPESSIDVVPNGFPDLGPPSRADRTSARAALRPGHDGPLIGFVGRLSAQKRPRLFLEAARSIAAANEAVAFVMLGDGDLRIEIESEIRADDLLRGRVAVLGGREDVQALYPGLDVLVNTSGYEGQPFSLIEAAFREVACVGFKIGGVDEVIVDGETGLMAPDPDPQALGRAALDLLASESRRRLMGLSARLRAVQHHSIEAMVRGTVATYRRLHVVKR